MTAANRPAATTNAGARGPGSSNGESSPSGAARGAAPSGVNDTKAKGGSGEGAPKARAASAVGDVARAVRHATQQLRDSGHETLATYVERGAQHVEQLAQRLNDKDVVALIRDARQFAARQPVLFVGSAFVLGLVGARFFKSSPSHPSSVPGLRGGDSSHGGISTAAH